MRFAVLPPHWNTSDLAILKSIGWSSILPGYENYPSSFQRVIPYLLASIVYHQDWIRSTLPANHPLFNQPIYSRKGSINIVTFFKDRVILGEGRCEKTGMMATGIPDNLVVSNKIAKLEEEVKQLSEFMRNGFKSDVIAEIQKQPEALKKMMLESFTVNGAVPVTVSDFDRLLNARNNEILRRLDALEQHRFGTPQADQVTNSNRQVAPSGSSDFEYFFWGGKHRMVPEDFQFPLFDVRTMFNLWYFGNATTKIQPYKRLKDYRDDLRTKANQNNFNRARLVMQNLLNIAREKNVLTNEVSDFSALPAQDALGKFDDVYQHLLTFCYPDGNVPSKRPNDLTLNTIADRIYKRQRTADQES